MKMKFCADKMIERCKKEGKDDLLDEKTVAFIKKLDGKECDTYNWQAVVKGAPFAWIAPDSDQDGTYVNVCDCI